MTAAETHEIVYTFEGMMGDDRPCQADAKQTRKQAKEKAKNMHARVFRKQDDFAANTSTETALVRAKLMAAQAKADACSTRKKKMFNRTKLMKTFKTNTSCSSISELEPLDCIDCASIHSLSSLSFLTNSSKSLLSVHTPITQGPDLFEPDEGSKKNEGSRKSACSPRKPRRYLEETNHPSLCLEGLTKDLHDDNTSSDLSSETTTGREWTEGSPPTTSGVIMPFRMASARVLDSSDDSDGDDDGLISDSSTTLHFSMNSSTVSISNLTADTFATTNRVHQTMTKV